MKAFWTCLAGICALGLFGSASLGGEFSLRPISASGTHSIVGTDEIRLTGGNQTVRIELFLSDWGPNTLKAWQARLDSSTYSNGIGADLMAAQLACPNAAFCAMNYEFGSRCVSSNCTAGFINSQRSDWVFLETEGCGIGVTKDVNTVNVNYLYFAVTDCALDTTDGTVPNYGGGLVLYVPPGAAGTYEIGFIQDPEVSFMADNNNQPYETALTGVRIVILCESAADCNDNNACTTDVCGPGNVCSNTPNYNQAQFCCNPADGALTPLSDGNQCTADICNPATGAVTHPNLPEFTACGSQANTQCDNPDSCNGMGTCLPRFEPPTTACGDPTNTTCNPADLCNGAGACVVNIASAGTPCGDPMVTPCNNADTCNGLGACLSNLVPNGTPCDDGLFCTISTTCSSGVCAGGGPRNCSDLLTCTADICNEDDDVCENPLLPDRCLISGVCYIDGVLNPANTCEICESATDTSDWTILPDDTECNDGNACTGTGREGIGVDTCTGGVCIGIPDPECNDQCEFSVPAVVGQNFSDNSSTGPDDGDASCQADSNNDVWFEYTADCDGAVFISTTGSSLSPVNDSVLSVFDECPTLGGVEIACDDDSGVGLNAALIFNTSAGQTYQIRVAGFEDNVGPIVLNLLPVNDCLIDGVCYLAGDRNPENDCQACIPQLSTTQWSPLPEATLCGNSENTDCTNPDACDGAGFCEPNHKPDGTQCTDEDPANECTFDVCDSGLCVHPPVPAGTMCGDAADTDCDNPDTCDGGGACVENYEAFGFPCGDQTESQCDNPDICDGVGECLENLKDDGTPCDDEDLCTGTDICTEGVCAGTSILQAPQVEAISGRHLRITPQPPGSPAPVALYVTSPEWPCLMKYVNLSGTLVGFDDRVIQLNDEWGTIIVTHPDIIPDTEYEVRAECGAFLSDPGSDTTYLWGDVNGDGAVNTIDISIISDRIKDLPTGIPDEAMDLSPCIPNDMINVIDLSVVVDVIKDFPYPCGLPCHD